MIGTHELHRFATSEGLRFDQTEKDYLIVWILFGFVQFGFRPCGWAFKGGTCLRHCYYPDYRFSDDIDFSVQPSDLSMGHARDLFEQVCRSVQEASGIQLRLTEARSMPGDLQTEIRIEYSRGGPRRKGLPVVKVHLSFDEPVLRPIVTCVVHSRYPDTTDFGIDAYAKEEIIAEKMRALIQQQQKWPRPRDLYDLWYILCHRQERYEPALLWNLFEEKCRVRSVKPDKHAIVSEKLRQENGALWQRQLGDVLTETPQFDAVWKQWVGVVDELF